MSRNPISINDIVDDSQKFKPEVLAALREFRHSKPWAGTPERGAKFLTLHGVLCEVTGCQVELAIAVPRVETSSVNSGYEPAENKIVLRGKLSVLTYLWLFRAVQTRNSRRAYRWAVSIFRRIFRQSFARLAVDAEHGIITSVPLTGLDNGPQVETPPAPEMTTPETTPEATVETPATETADERRNARRRAARAAARAARQDDATTPPPAAEPDNGEI